MVGERNGTSTLADLRPDPRNARLRCGDVRPSPPNADMVDRSARNAELCGDVDSWNVHAQQSLDLSNIGRRQFALVVALAAKVSPVRNLVTLVSGWSVPPQVAKPIVGPDPIVVACVSAARGLADEGQQHQSVDPLLAPIDRHDQIAVGCPNCVASEPDVMRQLFSDIAVVARLIAGKPRHVQILNEVRHVA